MVSAQRAGDGESPAGKCTVEWTSEGEQKGISRTERIFRIGMDQSRRCRNSQYVRRRGRSVNKGRRMSVRTEWVFLYQAGWHRRILNLSQHVFAGTGFFYSFQRKEQIWKATVCIFPVTPSDMACMKKSGRSAETTERVP